MKFTIEKSREILLLSENSSSKLLFFCYNTTMKYAFPLILWLLILDAVSKYFSDIYLREWITLIPNLLWLRYVENTWIAFSLPLEWLFLKILTVILISGIIFYYYKEERLKKSWLLHLSYYAIIAWALWNAWERIFRWYVTDFIAVNNFAVFNFADSYICLWAVWLIWYYWTHTS